MGTTIAAPRFANHADQIDYLTQRGRFAAPRAPKRSYATCSPFQRIAIIKRILRLVEWQNRGNSEWGCCCRQICPVHLAVSRAAIDRLTAYMVALS